MTRLFSMLLLLSFASQGFTDLSVEAQKKRLMGQIVAAEDPTIREKLQEVYESVGNENSEIYIGCILENMKGVANDFAAKAVESACRLKQESSIAQYEQLGELQADIKTIVVSAEKTKEIPAPSAFVTPKGVAGEQVGNSNLSGYELTDMDRLYLSKLDKKIADQEKIWKGSDKLNEDDKLLAYVNSVLNKIIPKKSPADFIKYRVSIFDSPQFQRIYFANGQIFISTGLLVTLGGEADLARVLADQVAHINLFHDLSVTDVDEKFVDFLRLSPEYYFEQRYVPVGGVNSVGGLVASALISGALTASVNRKVAARWEIQQERETEARQLATGYLAASNYRSFKPAIAYNIETGLPDVKGRMLDSLLHATFPNGLLPDSVAQLATVRSSYDPEYQELIWALTKKAIEWAADNDFSGYLLAISKGSEKQLKEDAQSSFMVADAYADSYLKDRLSESMRRAENWYLNSARLEPDNPIILHRMGEVYYRLNKPKQAARAFIQYLKSGDTSVERDLVIGRLRALKEALTNVEPDDG